MKYFSRMRARACTYDLKPVERFRLVDQEVSLATALAAIGAAVVIGVGPRGGDAAAHVYRTLLVRQGAVVWDNLWYAGHYPLASYSLLYYLPASLLGNVPLVVAAVLATAALFAAVVVSRWGAAARWPARAFALLACGPLFTGAYSYALGMAALLGTLRTLQRGRVWLALGAAALTLGFSPLAFVFLCLVLVALGASDRRRWKRAVVLGLGLALLAGLQLGVLALIPGGAGRYPFSVWRLASVLIIGTIGAALSLRGQEGRLVATFFVVWSLASVLVFLFPSPIGHNMTRLTSVVFPLMLLTASLSRYHPRPLAWLAVCLAFVYSVGPYVWMIPSRVDDRSASAAFWAPLLRFLERHSSPGYRVEVVPTANHWESYFVPRQGLALARGWYRQLDIADNPILYHRPLTARSYREWLRQMGVKFVVLPRAPLAPMGASWEADLLRSGRSGLRLVFRTQHGVIYQVPDARAILTGPAPTKVIAVTHTRIVAWAEAPGTYRLSVRYTPLWTVMRGDLCLRRTGDGMTQLDVKREGRFVLVVPDEPRWVVASLVDGARSACKGHPRRQASVGWRRVSARDDGTGRYLG